jgi:hypothetical protein
MSEQTTIRVNLDIDRNALETFKTDLDGITTNILKLAQQKSALADLSNVVKELTANEQKRFDNSLGRAPASQFTLQPTGLSPLPVKEPAIQTVGMQQVQQLSNPAASSSDRQHDMQMATATLHEWSPLVSSLQSGFSAINKDLGGWIKSVVGAKSVFQQFVTGVLTGLAQIGEKLAGEAVIAGVLSAITGGAGGGFVGILNSLSGFRFADGGILTEPVMGVGMSSGRSYMMGEAGPERISPLTNFGSSGGNITVEVRGEMRQRGQDLIGALNHAIIYDRKLGGGGIVTS